MRQSEISLTGRHVFVTGGTGSFGSKFIKMLLDKTNVSRVTSFSRDEHKNQVLREKFGVGRFDARLGDIRDKARLAMALRGVDYVVHAAAYKQAPLGEVEPLEFAKTNVFGTQNVIEACLESSTVKKALLVSTDKAVKPINLYGATKMMAERLFIQANEMKGSQEISFSCTRYGNVAGSRGTIVPIFLAMSDDDEIPITNRKATRFWIPLSKANEFVLDCLWRMKGGEIFVPDMPSVRVPDVAKALKPNCKTRIIGDRSGDKLHESLIAEFEKYDFKDGVYTIHPEGKSVGRDFSSGDNTFLSVDEIRESVEDKIGEGVKDAFAVSV